MNVNETEDKNTEKSSTAESEGQTTDESSFAEGKEQIIEGMDVQEADSLTETPKKVYKCREYNRTPILSSDLKSPLEKQMFEEIARLRHENTVLRRKNNRYILNSIKKIRKVINKCNTKMK